MRQILIYISWIVIAESSFGQRSKDIIGLYGECSDGYFACEQIEFKLDSSFEYGLFYDVGGWNFWKGTWKMNGDTIILNSYNQPKTEVEKSIAKEAYSFYTSGYITDLKFLLRGKKLYIFDFEKREISKKRFLKKTVIQNKKFATNT
jgi:hypothetical protein